MAYDQTWRYLFEIALKNMVAILDNSLVNNCIHITASIYKYTTTDTNQSYVERIYVDYVLG